MTKVWETGAPSSPAKDSPIDRCLYLEIQKKIVAPKKLQKTSRSITHKQRIIQLYNLAQKARREAIS